MPRDELTFEIQGQEEFIAIIDRMIQGIHPDKIEPELDKGASTIAREIRKRAPVGPTGNLKKAVRKKKLRRWFRAPAPSIAAIDRRKAPHAWLVTHGTSGAKRIVSPPKKVVIGGRPAVITHTGVMPPNRFFAEGVEAKQNQVLNSIAAAVGKNIEEAMR